LLQEFRRRRREASAEYRFARSQERCDPVDQHGARQVREAALAVSSSRRGAILVEQWPGMAISLAFPEYRTNELGVLVQIRIRDDQRV